MPQGIEIAVQPAEKSAPLLVPDQPWEQNGIGYTSGSYYKEGKYIMHYGLYMGYQCIAESTDGFAWRKPELGLVAFNGSTRNNIIYQGPAAMGHIFEDPAAPPAERFKLVGMTGGLYDRLLDSQGRPPLDRRRMERFYRQDQGIRGSESGGCLQRGVESEEMSNRPRANSPKLSLN